MIPPNIFSGALLWAPLPLFLLQILIILVVVRVLGKVLHAVNQPMVIGEIIAGVLLGPSVFGYIPGFTSTIFPDSSKDFLTLFSSVGLCFFMFFLGLEVDPVFMMQSWRSTLPIAFVSMSIPFGVGVSVATWLFTLESDEQYNRLSFLLFIGTVFSFSAFPVLARILDSTKLISSPVGIQALGLAALEDVVAWCVLALIISYSSTAGGTAPGAVVPQSSAWNAILIFVILVAFIAILMAVIRPIINYFYIRKQNNGENLESDFIPYLFFGFLIASWFTETLGIHAFFGSFLFGCILPKEGDLIPILAPRIELLIVHIFLPIYFANSGMKTQLQKLDSIEIWLYTLIIIVIASVAKITSVTLSSKLVLGIRKKRIRSFLDEYSNDSSDNETENEFVDATCDAEDVEVGVAGATTHHEQHPRDHLQQLHKHQTSQLNLFQHASINHAVGDADDDGLPKSHSIENIDYDTDAEDYTQEGTDEVALPTKDAEVRQVKLHRNHLPNSNANSNSRDASSTHLTASSSVGGSKRNSIIRTVHPAMVAEASHTPTTTTGAKRISPISTGDNSDTTTTSKSSQRTQVSGIHTPISVNSSSTNLVSHSNRTHAIPDLAPEVLVDEEDQDEFGLDIHTGLPIVSDDEALIQEFSMNSWVHCLTLGVLLNSRGLVALIVLNIGLDKGIIGPKIFSMMLTMSIICTCLTSPVVYALYGYRWQKALLKMQASDLAEAVQLEEAEETYLQHELSHKDTTLMYPGQVFSQDYHDQLAQMMEANRKANALAALEHSLPSTTVSNSAMTESPPTESVSADPLQQPLLSPPTTELTSSPPMSASPPTTIPQAQARFRAKGRAASSSISIGGGGSSARSQDSNGGGGYSPESQSGSYIPPILARLRSNANDSVASSAGTSPSQPNHMPPVMPQLGLGFNGLVSPRPVSSTSGVSRFGAPQLSSQLSIRHVGSPAPSISIVTQPQSAASPAPLARRASVFTLLGTSPSVSGLTLNGPGVDGARSISTRQAMQQPSILHQRQASRIESGMNTPRNNGGSGTPKNQGPSTPRGGHGRGQSVFAASSRHIFSQQAPLSPNSATSTTSSTNSARSPPPNFGRAKTYVGLSQTPTNFSMVPTISEFPPPLNLGHKSASTAAAPTSFTPARLSNNSVSHESDED